MLFFIWLIALEFILGWETIELKITKQNKIRALLYGFILFLPTMYVIVESYFGLTSSIAGWAQQNGVVFFEWMPLAVEYFAFSVLFLLAVGVSFGRKGLTGFLLPALFVALVGALYAIDNAYPYGSFTPFQMLVPTTTNLASGVLGLMGNSAVVGTDLATGMPTIDVTGQLGTAKFAIAWPCAGIEGLLIFTAVALLFLKRMRLSLKAKVGFFAFGAAVTYFINVLRISTIFTIAMQYGVNSSQVQDFHYYYGPLYSMMWIVSYPMIILALTGFWKKVRKPQPVPLSPASPTF